MRSKPPQEEAGEQVALVRSPALPGVELKTVRNAQRLWRVFHEKYSLVSPIAGGSGRLFRGKTITRRPGELMLYEPGDCDTNTFFEAGSAFHVISIEKSVLEAGLPEIGGSSGWSFTSAQVESQPLAARVLALAAALQRADPASATEAVTELVDLLARDHLALAVAPRRSVACSRDRTLSRVCEQLHADLPASLNIDALAREVGLDRYQLLRRFKAYFGTTPYAYRQALRVARARTMLRRDRTPSEVGTFLGFADFSHFRRTFVKYVGMSPNQYRRAAQ